MMTTHYSPAPTPATTADEAVTNPRTGRSATALQGILMLVGCCLPLLGSVLLAPILPAMAAHFRDVPGVAVIVPLVLSTPALFIAIGAPFAGAIVDRIGRRRLLIGSLIVYGIFGTAPLFLGSLWAILASRVGVGIAEAGVMTCATAMLADYFTGARRNRYMSLQTVVMALAATAFFVIGGALGSGGWRTPFWLYASSIVLAVLVGLFAWQPAGRTAAGADKKRLPDLPWKALSLQVVVAFLCGVAFYAIIVELPFVLDDLGVKAPAIIGLATAAASVATALGAICFRFIARFGVSRLVPLAFGLSGVGLITMLFAHDVAAAIVGATIASAGSGLMFPTLLIWTLSRLDFDQRGRATGWWTGAVWLGQFASPLVVAAITAAIGGLQPAIGVLGVFVALVAIALAVILRHEDRHALVHSPA